MKILGCRACFLIPTECAGVYRRGRWYRLLTTAEVVALLEMRP